MDIQQEVAESTFLEQFLGAVCEYKFLLRLVLVFEILFLLMGGLSFLYGDLGRGTFVILTVTLVTDSVVLLSTIGLMYACRNVSGPEEI
ncbi:hypothetical protein [Haloarcula marina]|uniref:hypothetical protein n=1 Tax=Haloarcula marina TaxID=2961574 RepID=UPI0020B8346F|nr:hypothetical protein [Halomicroarcula marina]